MEKLDHLGGANSLGDWQTYLPDIWGWLLLEFDIRSVIDLGTGYGHNAEWFRKMGCRVKAVEAEPDALQNNVLPAALLIPHDYSQGPLNAGEFDLCLALEFVEHVEARYEANWLMTAKQCQWLLMSHGLPGQDGHHHVNCRPREYWIARLMMEGFWYQADLSSRFRETCRRVPSPWGRNTLLLFTRIHSLEVR
jgi:hypothetical protein